ncbi:MAG: hypothetical protein B0W54_09870 [Cellvibrio sp. 79]|nr:MAG: hypothetical protein B0W54_09870 [Cellvibrio sp. 79]
MRQHYYFHAGRGFRLLFLLLTCLQVDAGQPLPLTIPAPGSLEPEATGIYYEKVLRLALSKTTTANDTSGILQEPEYTIVYHKQTIGRERFRLLVKQGVVDVIWSSSNKQREEEFAPVKFNLLHGINEYRALLIRVDDQHRFDKVKTIDDLRQFKIGSGIHWSDTQIYHFNSLPVVTSYAFDTMFRMLAARRFDYMARSLQEIDQEIEQYGKLGLTVEKKLLIHYQQPIYFFLNKKNDALAKRIERGLLIAQADGSLDEIFMSIPSFRAAQEKIRHIDRKVIELRSED